MPTQSNTDFFERVYALVRQIPCGRVTTYGSIGKALGLRSSARMVGWAMHGLAGKNTDIPAHRVVNRFGALSGKNYFATPTLMRELLESEGIEFIDDVVNIKKHIWEPEMEE